MSSESVYNLSIDETACSFGMQWPADVIGSANQPQGAELDNEVRVLLLRTARRGLAS